MFAKHSSLLPSGLQSWPWPLLDCNLIDFNAKYLIFHVCHSKTQLANTNNTEYTLHCTVIRWLAYVHLPSGLQSWPWPFESLNPEAHWHLNEPLTLLQSCGHPFPYVEHSSTSDKKIRRFLSLTLEFLIRYSYNTEYYGYTVLCIRWYVCKLRIKYSGTSGLFYMYLCIIIDIIKKTFTLSFVCVMIHLLFLLNFV